MGKGKRTADGLHIVAYENGTSQKLPAMLSRCDKLSSSCTSWLGMQIVESHAVDWATIAKVNFFQKVRVNKLHVSPHFSFVVGFQLEFVKYK